VPVTVTLPNQTTINTRALIDSGAQKSFVNSSFVNTHNVATASLPHPIRLNMADGDTSTSGPVTQQANLQITIAEHHRESLTLHVTKLQSHAIILGIDWLHTHNPAINWRKHIVSFQDDFCNKHCLEKYPALSLDTLLSSLDHETLEPTVDDYYLCQLISEFCEEQNLELPCLPDLSCFSLSLRSVDTTPVPAIPEAYAEFAPLFKDREPGTLPPHRPFDHTIPLEPNSKVPFGPLYTLSQKELEELRKYIDENLKKGFIRRSESPAGAPVLFTPKKDTKLRLCVDYRALNNCCINLKRMRKEYGEEYVSWTETSLIFIFNMSVFYMRVKI
jgi:hypothetical protein